MNCVQQLHRKLVAKCNTPDQISVERLLPHIRLRATLIATVLGRLAMSLVVTRFSLSLAATKIKTIVATAPLFMGTRQ